MRHYLPVLLAAIFWIAQLQGTVHGIGHVSNVAAASDHLTLPHALHCDECATLAQASAAPLPALPSVILLPAMGRAVFSQRIAPARATALSFYRSRAPPPTPV